VEHGSFPEELYLGIQQAVLGQIGWRIDTRVKGVRVASLGEYGSWFAGAQAADRLAGDEDLDGAEAETGGVWRVFGKNTMAVLDPVSPTGLIHALVRPGKEDRSRVGLVWRFVDERNYWGMEVDWRECKVIRLSEGDRRVYASASIPDSTKERSHRLQVLDDGRYMMAYVDGEPITGSWISDTRFEGATGVGILLGIPGR
jgi:hypothetical protein